MPDLRSLKQKLPLPDLLHQLGLGHCTKPSCRSPLRYEENASWGIFEHRGMWFWKDHGTGEKGDEIQFLAGYLRLDIAKHFQLVLSVYSAIAEAPRQPIQPVEQSQSGKPDFAGFARGSTEEFQRLSDLRQIPIDALDWAYDRQALLFNPNWNGQEVYAVTDQSQRSLELRRLDGQNFPEFGQLPERKTHSVRGSQKSWPLGIQDAAGCKNIVLVEGGPDFLAAHALIMKEETGLDYIPVAMLGAACSISSDALPHFKGKSVTIYPHADEAGLNAAGLWKNQIMEAGALKVMIFDLTRVSGLTNGRVKDLNDLLREKDPLLFQQNPSLNSIITL